MAPEDKSRNNTPVAQVPHTETKLFLRNAAVPGSFERHMLAGGDPTGWLGI
jgi:hypothetical protein